MPIRQVPPLPLLLQAALLLVMQLMLR